MQWVQRVQQVMRAGGDFVFPPTCLLCQRSLKSSSVRLCPTCLNQLKATIYTPRCQRCSAPVGPNLNAASGCIHCRTDDYKFENVISLGAYVDLFRDACLKFKQGRGAPLAHRMTQLLQETFYDELSALKVDCLIPVPHHWTDRLLQSHHPPDTIADQLSRFLMVPVQRNILRKIKRTPKQGRLTPSARRQNLRKAFHVDHRDRLDGQHVLLVDDILTTGTTANRVTQVLKQAGAEHVSVVVIARAIGIESLPSLALNPVSGPESSEL